MDPTCDSTKAREELLRALSMLEAALPRFELACKGPDFPSPEARALFCADVARMRSEVARLRLESSAMKLRH